MQGNARLGASDDSFSTTTTITITSRKKQLMGDLEADSEVGVDALLQLVPVGAITGVGDLSGVLRLERPAGKCK